MTPEITLFKPELFAAAARFISTEEVRFFLQGVYIEPAATGAFLVATDGHRLFVGHDTLAVVTRAAIIRPPKRKMPPAWFKSATLKIVEGTAHLYDAKGERIVERALASEIDGTYPDWRHVLPASVSGELSTNVTYDATYLQDFATVRAKLDVVYASLVPVGWNGLDPAIVEIRPGDCFGVLMPARTTAPTQRPQWFDAETRQSPREAAE